MLYQFKFDGAVSVSKIGCDMGIGVAVFTNGIYREPLSIFKGFAGTEESSVNISEWNACVECFKLINEFEFNKKDKIEVHSDSQVIAYQFNGDYIIRNEKFKYYYDIAWDLAMKANLKNIRIKWFRREFNKEADILSKKGLKSLYNV